MSDTWGNPLGFLFAGDKNDPRVNQQLRQRIALAMMARDKKYPKNVGEGLSAIGDAIAERKMMQSLLQGDLSQQDQAKAAASGLTGAPPAAAASPQSYAPPDSLPPAVAAINSAASQGDAAPLVPPEAQPPPPLETAPSQPASMLAPQMPTGIQGVTATPLSQAMNPQPMLPPQARVAPAPAPGPQAGADGYNMLDAQTGLKRPGSGRTQDAVMRAYPNNPDMQAYLSSLSAGEWRGPGDVSSTGARGPWQFVPGTARQYGLSNPDDVDASAMAAKQFTQDNAATFERINGRPPTMAELAVMHQQGGATGANMVAGTGNASPRNLSLNNVDPGAGPGAAVARIKGYYGLPDRPVDTRDAIASQLLAQGGDPTAPAVPPPNPTMTGANGSPDQRLALAAPQGPVSDIQSAPPVPSGIRAAPPVQVAQAAPKAAFDYVMPAQGAVKPPQQVPLSPEGQKALAVLNANPNNDYIKNGQVGQTYANALADQKLRQDQANEEYKAQLTQARELEMKRQEQIATQAKRGVEGQEAQAKASMEAGKAAIASRIGGQDPEKFLSNLAQDRDAAQQSVNILKQSKIAKQALNEGIVTGAGADFRVNMEKMKAMFGNESAAQLAARSEQYLAAVKSTLNGAIQNIQGKDPKVTDSDVKVASGLIGADLNLQNQTLHKLVDQTIESQHQKLNKYEDLKDYYIGGTKLEKMYDIRTDPTVTDKRFIDRLVENKNDPEARRQFDQRFGAGAAELEIARAQRQSRRPQSGGN